MALISFDAFNQLQPRSQLTLVLMQGTYLTTRFDEAGKRFTLYYMGRFFAEVHYDAYVAYEYRCYSFVSMAPLEAYLDGIQLPAV